MNYSKEEARPVARCIEEMEALVLANRNKEGGRLKSAADKHLLQPNRSPKINNNLF